MFFFKKSTTSSVLAAERLSLVPPGAASTKYPSPSDFIAGKLGVTPTKVAGEVVLNYPDSAPIKLKRIEIVLRGQYRLQWAEEVPIGDGFITEKRFKRKMLLNRKLVLWESTVGEFVEMTSDRFPFSFNLPNTLLSSIKTDNADVSYSLDASVTRPGTFADDVKRIVIDLPLANQGALLAAIMAAPVYRNDMMGLTSPPNHAEQGISWRCTVAPGGCVYRGEQVTVTVALAMPPHLKHIHVTHVSLALKEHTAVYDDNRSERLAYVRYVTKTGSSEFSYKGHEHNVTGRIERPLIGMADTCKFPPHFSISHSVEFKVFMSGVDNIEVEAPVRFSSIMRDEVQPMITAHGDTITATVTTTTTAAAGAINNFDAPPAYERGDWTPNPPADAEGSALPPPAYDTL
ncbi:hypothetical protein GQ42DRAFT_162428 [Ramicandelaber brevisporus]|nr:hypothetical protein GQ42DRAFT_162428 [Ramicandelaber brevisporus]